MTGLKRLSPRPLPGRRRRARSAAMGPDCTSWAWKGSRSARRSSPQPCSQPWSPARRQRLVFLACLAQAQIRPHQPDAGLGRCFPHAAGGLVKAILKATLIGGVACIVLWQARDQMLELAGQPFDSAIATLGNLVMVSVFAVAGVMILIVAFDVRAAALALLEEPAHDREDLSARTGVGRRPHVKPRSGPSSVPQHASA